MTDLRNELLTDPLVPPRGYATMSDQAAADDLNTVYRTRDRTSMTGRQVKAEVVDAEYDALSAEKKAQLLSLTSADDLDPFGFAANIIKDVFGSGSATRAALAVARVENITRATELGISPNPVLAGQVETARQ